MKIGIVNVGGATISFIQNTVSESNMRAWGISYGKGLRFRVRPRRCITYKTGECPPNLRTG